MSSHVTIPTEQDHLVLRQLVTEQDDLAYFSSLLRSRVHLMDFEPDTIEKYQTLESVRQARINPLIENKLRLGIWADEQFAGSINLIPQLGKAEIGYWLDVDHTGKGYATMAVRALSAYGLKNHMRVYGRVNVANIKSANVLRRVGYEQTAQIAEYLIFSLYK